MTGNDLRHAVAALVLGAIVVTQMVISYLMPEKYDWTALMWTWTVSCWGTAIALFVTIHKIGRS